MTWDSVPYFTQYPGAAHDPEVFRTSLFAATHGSEGIVEGTDLKVVPLSTPGNAVIVGVGAALIRSRDVGGGQQTYAARNPTPDQTPAIPATGSTGGRSVMIVARVEDPGMDGNTYPDPSASAAADGPYVFTRVIENVPSTATRLQDVAGHANDSGIALARIDIPASTSTITAGMIVDLRKLASPRRQRVTVQQAMTLTGSQSFNLTATSSAMAPGDSQASVAQVDVPAWAGLVVLRADVVGVIPTGGAVGGFLEARLGTGTQLATAGTSYNDQRGDGATRLTMPIVDTLTVPAAFRGTTQRLRIYGRKQAAGPGYLQWQSSTQHFWDLEFVEAVS